MVLAICQAPDGRFSSAYNSMAHSHPPPVGRMAAAQGTRMAFLSQLRGSAVEQRGGTGEILDICGSHLASAPPLVFTHNESRNNTYTSCGEQ